MDLDHEQNIQLIYSIQSKHSIERSEAIQSDSESSLKDTSEVKRRKSGEASQDAKNKTPVTLLQEISIKAKATPEYQFLGQSGPHHMPMFRCSCSAFGLHHVGEGPCKRTAKHEAAAGILAQLKVPTTATSGGAPAGAPPPHHIALLNELCLTCRLPAPQYDLVADTGPPHSRRFEVRVSVGSHSRTAAASTKKDARRDAAAELYRHLRAQLPHCTAHFSEDQALEKALATAISRRGKDALAPTQSVWRPAFDLAVNDYHRSLAEAAVESANVAAVAAALAASDDDTEPADYYQSPELQRAAEHANAGEWSCALDALRLPHHWDSLDAAEAGAAIAMLVVERTTPSLVFAGAGPTDEVAQQAAGARAARYIAIMLADVH